MAGRKGQRAVRMEPQGEGWPGDPQTLGKRMRRAEEAQRRQARERYEEEQREKAEAFRQAIAEIWPRCECESTDIRPRFDSHMTDPGKEIIGPGGYGPRYSTSIMFLYCVCGHTFFNEKVEGLSSRYQSGEFTAEPPPRGQFDRYDVGLLPGQPDF